ncbi:polymorphic toxin-type HINT domain-containing protein [Streptacidiphilus sp. EB129]|uniref:polymorphic toxin-type HINT domain-containing protein n=1 Tax=Streptacidiphilus sp. EB129 TaxID=3156262 RepID=UPI003514A344
MRAKLWWGRHRGPWGRVALSVVGALVAQAGLAEVAQALPTLPKAAAAAAPRPDLGNPVPVTPVPVKQLPHRAPPVNYTATATHWPASAASTLPLGTARNQAAGSPVWGQALPSTKGAYSGPSSLGVKVLSHSAATAAGVSGILAQVTPVGTGRGAVRVGVDYSAFAQGYGGDYATRLRLVELPACALTTPQVAACRVQTRLASVNDTAAKSLSATVTLGQATTQPATTATSATVANSPARTGAVSAAPLAAGSGGAMVMALTSAPSSGDGGSAGGQYGATSLKPSGSWSAGGSSGSFDYTYPISVPPAVSGLAPSVGLSYDSGSVDGQTASTQAQSSWVGDGWSTADSFIEQSFVTCADSPEGVTLPSADQTGDMCYDGPVLTLSLNGSTTSLIWDASKGTNGTWKPANDNGDVVTQVTGSGNGSGTYNTDYWTVTDRAGTVYSFGLNELPGWSSGKATTNSVDSEPVYSANPGDPCNSTAGFTSSVCTMAYRWHLDYVKDLHGNAMSYYYKQDTNYYGEDNGAHNVPYVRDSHLDHIDYGFTDGNAYGTVPDKVAYTPGERCVSGTCDPMASNPANWPDVPVDLVCAQGATCTSYGPAFFSTVRLTAIATEQWNGSAYNTVDSWALGQSIPTTGTYNTSTVRLDSITRSGNDTTAGGSAVPLPQVTFGYQMTANRVNFTTGTGSGLGPLNRYRLNAITTEAGSVISVVYELVNACTPTSIQSIAPSSNTASCFPVVWTPSGGSPYTDWFNKYTVQSVSQSDPSGKSAGLFTAYSYPGGGAWHYDDNELVQAKYRTYGQWRGYGDVQTRTGQGVDPVTKSETWYYRGMDGDWLSSTSTRSVTLTDSQGGTHTDADQLAGDALESTAYTYDGGPVDHSTISSYWVSPATATRTRTGLPALTANAVGQVETWIRQAVTSTAPTSWRTTETDVSFDTTSSSPTFGMQLFSYDHGDLSLVGGSASQETCTQTTYAPANTSLNLVGLVAETETDDKPCGGTSPAGSSAPTSAQTNALTAPTSLNKATDVISDTRTFYDNPTMAGTWPQPASPTWPQAAPTLGAASVEQVATGYAGGAFTYQSKTATVYDSYGRPTAAYDGDGNKTTTAYTDTSYLTTTAIKATNALGQSATTTLDPERALTLTSTDINGVTTTVHSDGLGRTLAVWKNSRATTSPANLLDSYSFPASGTTAPVVVTTQTLNDESGYSTSTTLLDALMRVRQTQYPAVSTSAGRIISDTFYDTHGWVYKTNANYWDTAASPNGTLVTVADNYSHQQTLTSYDGLGQPTVVTSLDDSQVKQTGYTQYLGDSTRTVPPTGAAATATVVDALGRTTEHDQYSAAPTVTTSTTGGFTTASITGGTTQATKYTFNAQGRAYQTIDTPGDTWSTSYDFLGQPVTKADPDAGTTPANSPTLYDAAGNTLQSTDSAGHTQSFTYDALNRKTAAYDATVANQASGNEVASWAYDNSNNAVPAMTDPIGHVTTTTSYTPAGAFTVQAKGFNVFGESLGETYTVPGTGGLSGSYAYLHSYNTITGSPKATLVPAAGGMAQEVLNTGYCGYSGLDMPCTLGGTYGYTQNVAYTGLGQVAQEIIGSPTNKASVSNTYDPHTGALTDQNVVNNAVSSTPMDDTSYGYDPSGNITSQTDVRNGTTTETQCYTFDPLDRLSQAWTTASSTTGTCNTQPTASNVTTTVGDGISGSAYWTSWTYDTLGQPQTQTQHSPTGGTDTTTGYTYGGSASGCPTSTGAHTLTSATTTGGSSSASTYCYDGLGNTTTRTTAGTQQNLAWNDQGKLQSATTGTSTTNYYYDASGSVIERTDPGTVTLFLPAQQITFYTGSNSLNAVRNYPLPGGGQVVLTNASYGFTLSDQHSTATLSLDSTAKNPTWKQYTPYGAPRGTTPGSWLDPNGYLDKPQDTNDALTTIGARQYDTTLGRFISLDPVLEAAPQQLNGYTYAGSNPVTSSDPSGMCPRDECTDPGGDGNPTPGIGSGGMPPASVCDQHPNAYACPGHRDPLPLTPAAESRAVAADAAGAAKAQAVADAKTRAETAAANRSCSWYDAICQAEVHANQIETAALVIAAVAAVVVICVVAPEVAIAAAIAFGEAAGGGSLAMAAVAAIGAGVSTAAEGAGLINLAIGAAVVADAAGASHAVGGGGAADAGGVGESACSFAPSTPVLMADGTAKPIGTLKAGDKVESANPETGKEEGARTVQHVWINHDNDLLDLTVTTGHGHTTTIHTTANHPFWDDTTHSWVSAGKLHPGHHLASTHGQQPTVEAITITPGAANRYNLTVQQLHTYYVLAGTTPVLVHNCNVAPSTWTPDDNYSPGAVKARSAENQAYYGTPQEVHNTVSAIEDGSISQRISGGGPDSYQVRPSTPRGYRWWGGSTIYTGVGGPSTLTRVLVNSNGSVGYLLGHNYNQVFSYPWANLPGAYTGQ